MTRTGISGASLDGSRGLCGLWLPVPDGAVGHDVAAGALPLDIAAIFLARK